MAETKSLIDVPIDTPSFLQKRKYLIEQYKDIVNEIYILYRRHALFTCPYPIGTKCSYLGEFGPVPAEVIEFAYLSDSPYYQLKIRTVQEGAHHDRWVTDFKRLVFDKGTTNARKAKA
jgi:hypothetical protein